MNNEEKNAINNYSYRDGVIIALAKTFLSIWLCTVLVIGGILGYFVFKHFQFLQNSEIEQTIIESNDDSNASFIKGNGDVNNGSKNNTPNN